MRVIILQDALARYRVDLFNHLALQEGIDLLVIILSSNLRDQQWDTKETLPLVKFPYVAIKPRSIRIGHRSYHTGISLYRQLEREAPDIILSGELSINTIISIIYSKFHHIPLIVWWAGTMQTDRGIPWIKKVIRKFMVRRINGFLAYSRSAYEYLLTLGIPSRRIHIVGNITFETLAFHDRVEQSKGDALLWKRKNQLGDKKIILTVGALIPRKNLPFLLRGISELPKVTRDELVVVAVGEGLMQKPCEELAQSLGVRLLFPGHIDPSAIYIYYAAADIFVQPTLLDHWSQSVNEGMASGLPVLVSNRDHAVEIIDHGNNGFIISPDDPAGLAKILHRILENPLEARSIGSAAFQTVQTRDVEYASNIFLDAFHQSLVERDSL